jgi:eukaryotic-like serine/threonine-protein kinase
MVRSIARQLDEHARPMDRTMTGLRLMTPAYASPQQIHGEATGVDSDVYSLGVILYQLLADRPPFDFTACTQAEAEALVLEREPERPSVVSRRSAGSRWRGRPAAALSDSGWADLDVLCLTAMHKDPGRRYRTVQAVIHDIDHFLAGQPLDARPDSFGYRAGKFARRNRVPLSIAGAAIGGLVSVAAFYTFRVAKARNTALNEAARAQRIQQFMLNLFEGGDTEAGPAEDLRVTTLLDRGVREADALGNEPTAQADLYQTLGRIYQKLGQFDRADDLFGRALTARRALFGPDSPQVGDTMVAQADLRTDQARYDEAEQLARQALARAESTLPVGHPLIAAATRTLGRVLEERGQYEAAIPVLAAAMQRLEAAGDTLQLAHTAHELANVEFYSGHYDASEALNRRALAIYRQQFGEAHPHVGDSIINLGAIEFERGDDAQAERLYREGIAITEAWYGRDHYRTANNLVMLGRTLTRRDKLEEAFEVLQRALIGRERTYGPNHPSVASVLNELGTIARKRNLLDEAESSYRRMESIYRAIYADVPHFLIGIALSNLGSVRHLRGDFDGAAQLFQQATAIFTSTQGVAHVNTAIARVKLAATLLKKGLAGEAEREAAAAHAILGVAMNPDALWMTEARTVLADAYDALNEPERAATVRSGAAAGTA